MQIEKVIDLLGDKIFTVTFVKKDGSIRVMNARRGVKKGVKGVGMSYDPTQKDLVVVFDMQKEALKQDDVWSKRFIYIFSGLWSLFAMVFIFAITFGTVPEANIRFADSIIGFLMGTIIATMIQFFYGSSISSRKKTEELVEGLRYAAKSK